jgi:cyclopropane fatty-acyl-phospholipid synthase-like methyltransferase
MAAPAEDLRRFSDACVRNREPIAAVLAPLLDAASRVLEIGAGTGQHAVHFAGAFPDVLWQPIDRPEWLPSIDAWRALEGPPNLLPPLPFDLFDDALPEGAKVASPYDAVVAINVLHIAPEAAMARLFAHARASVPTGGVVFVYGPFRAPDRPLEPSNEAFDAWLKARDPASGIRETAVLDAIAAEAGFTLEGDVAMPANNRSRWWRRTG